jgi:hypothetical protein
VITCVCVASTLPALSHERNSTVVVCDTVNEPAYNALEELGAVPSVVYRVAATPEPASTADSDTVTGPEYADPEHAAPLHAIDVTGGVVSAGGGGGGGGGGAEEPRACCTVSTTVPLAARA